MNQDSFLHLKKRLHALILRYVKGQDDAKDILQEIFLKVINNNHQDSIINEEAWLYTVARNACLNHIRKNSYTNTHQTSLNYESFELGHKLNYNEEFTECLPLYLAKLPLEYQQAVTMAELEQLSHQQIADRLNISLPAAKSRVFRGRKKLKEAFEAGCHMKFDVYGNLITCFTKKNTQNISIFS